LEHVTATEQLAGLVLRLLLAFIMAHQLLIHGVHVDAMLTGQQVVDKAEYQIIAITGLKTVQAAQDRAAAV
jgi:hypothetical protein